MPSLSALGKGLFTAARIADAGLSVYQVTDEVWYMIDPYSRHPELRKLTNRMLEKGRRYDEKLDKLIDQSNHLTNLSNALHMINCTVMVMDNQGVSIFKHYEELAKLRETFDLKYPDVRIWFDESWIRRNNPNPKQYQTIMEADEDFNFYTALNYVFVAFGAGLAGYKVKSLITMGVDSYRRHGVRGTRPRANAVVAPTSRIGRLEQKWTMFKVRHPKMYKTMQSCALGASLGLNLFLIIEKARRISEKEEYLKKQIDTLDDNIRFVEALLEGCKDSRQLLDELIKHYKLTDDNTNRDELKIGVDGLLKHYNKNLDDCLSYIDNTFDELVKDARAITEDDKKEINKIRGEHDEFKRQVVAIKGETNGELRKKKIGELNTFVNDTLVERFTEWINALSKINEMQKIMVYLTKEAGYVVEDFGDQIDSAAGRKMIARRAIRMADTLSEMYPDQSVYKSKDELVAMFIELVRERNKVSKAA